jgi:geranylgeranyl diphosphate synthase type I
VGAARSPSANDVLAKAHPENFSSLARLKPLISTGLKYAVGALSPRLRRIVSYHMGWQDEQGRETEGDGGKALRPTISLLAAEAVGAQAKAALPGAVAIELVHNFSLLHDDVMDGDRERRHRPAVWAQFGMGEAIIAGDALLALAQRILLADPKRQGERAARELNRATAEMIEGQSEDLSFEARVDVSIEECLTMSRHKTSALISAAAGIGGILGGGDEQNIGALRSFGTHLGLAFQAVDDDLGIWGDPAVTGKPAANDLRQRKKTIPVVHALAGDDGSELRALLSKGKPTESELRRAVDIIDRSGSREWTRDLAWRNLVTSMSALEGALLLPQAADELRQLAGFVVRRDF